jgi:hypothetical protein
MIGRRRFSLKQMLLFVAYLSLLVCSTKAVFTGTDDDWDHRPLVTDVVESTATCLISAAICTPFVIAIRSAFKRRRQAGD